MSFYTDWFIAEDTDAEAIASIVTTEERSHEDWPNLGLRNIGEFELQLLYDLLRPGRDGGKDVSGELLFTDGEEGPFVSRVEPLFLDALVAIKTGDVPALAERWRNPEALFSWSPDELAKVIRSIVKFVKLARKAGKPVLQMAVI
jgi:hypothetical protein